MSQWWRQTASVCLPARPAITTKQTAHATEDISGKIEAIQGDARQAVGAIRAISDVMINDFQTIAGVVEEQTAITNEMGRS